VECARLSGEYRLESAAAKLQNRRKQLSACHKLEVRISEHKAAIKKEVQFNRQVELNTKIKELEKQLLKTSADL
jgi:hypothetical protein